MIATKINKYIIACMIVNNNFIPVNRGVNAYEIKHFFRKSLSVLSRLFRISAIGRVFSKNVAPLGISIVEKLSRAFSTLENYKLGRSDSYPLSELVPASRIRSKVLGSLLASSRGLLDSACRLYQPQKSKKEIHSPVVSTMHLLFGTTGLYQVYMKG